MAISVIGAQGLVNPALSVTTYTSGSGTYTTPTGARYLIVEMCGGGSGGGGGGGNGSNFATIAGGNGSASTFGTSLLTANGGTNGGGVGTGGTVTVNSPAIAIIAQQGGYGLAWQYNYGTTAPQPQSPGGTNPFGGTYNASLPNTGNGGLGGNLINTTGFSGNGGGAGGYIKAAITSPAATYAYSVGSGGTAGVQVGSNGPGTAGGSGVIIVTAYF